MAVTNIAKRNWKLSALWGLIVIGGGQFYNGDLLRALIFSALAIQFGYIFPYSVAAYILGAIWVVSLCEAVYKASTASTILDRDCPSNDAKNTFFSRAPVFAFIFAICVWFISGSYRGDLSFLGILLVVPSVFGAGLLVSGIVAIIFVKKINRWELATKFSAGIPVIILVAMLLFIVSR